MKRLAVIYHSGHGHTAHIAGHVAEGAGSREGIGVDLLPAGDKQSTLLSMFTFCMQHGMLWLGNPILPGQHAGVPCDEAANRLGSWSGLMAQAGHASPADAFPPGDIKTARLSGRQFAATLQRLTGERP